MTAKSFGMQQNKLPVDGKRGQCSEAFVRQRAAQSREATDESGLIPHGSHLWPLGLSLCPNFARN